MTHARLEKRPRTRRCAAGCVTLSGVPWSPGMRTFRGRGGGGPPVLQGSVGALHTSLFRGLRGGAAAGLVSAPGVRAVRKAQGDRLPPHLRGLRGEDRARWASPGVGLACWRGLHHGTDPPAARPARVPGSLVARRGARPPGPQRRCGSVRSSHGFLGCFGLPALRPASPAGPVLPASCAPRAALPATAVPLAGPADQRAPPALSSDPLCGHIEVAAGKA